jgi:hypothetical protein
MSKTVWKRKTQECAGSYQFKGNFYVTRGVADALSPESIKAIYDQVQAYVQEKGGADYLFVFEDDRGGKLFFIDQLNQEMIASGDYLPEYNYCTLLWAHEY